MAGAILFHWADYLVFGIFLTASAAIGFVVAWKDKKRTSSKDFLVGGRSMHWLPTALSMQASFLSAVYILSTPVETYYFGTMFCYIVVGCAIAYPLASHIFLALYYKLKIVSAYEYLERRFNKIVRIAGAITFCIMILLYNSVLLYTPAIALAQGLSINISILVCGFICTLYTTMGGMKATIWIDFIQMLIVFVGLITITALGSREVGGISKVWEANVRGGRIIFDNFQIDPTIKTTFWTQVVGAGTGAFALWVANQVIVQKFISVRSLEDAHKSVYFNIFTNLFFTGMASLMGIVAYAYFEGCDPILSKKIEMADQIVPLFVMEVAGNFHGLPGIFMASIFSAALSSLSGGLTALSAVTTIDYILPIYLYYKKKPMAELSRTVLTRALVFVFGLVAIGTGYLAQFVGKSILRLTISIFGFVGGPLVSLIFLGVLFPFVNSWGVLVGLVSSLTISSWLAIGSVLFKGPSANLPISSEKCFNVSNSSITHNETTSLFSHSTISIVNTSVASGFPDDPDVPWYYRISFFYYALISLVVAVVVAIPVSLITGRAKNVDPNLTFNYFEKCCNSCAKRPGTRAEFKVQDEVLDVDAKGRNKPKDESHINFSFQDHAIDTF